MRRPIPQLLACMAATLACPRVSVDVRGRPCGEHDQCIPGYTCRPDIGLCVPAITIDCQQSDATCAWRTKTGDRCPAVDAFLPCAAGRRDCLAGCRTCQMDGTWSECSAATCVLGEPWSCSGCAHDCRTQVKNAEPACAQDGTCTYMGKCIAGTVDADEQPSNGCECTPTGNDNLCNGIDDDCNGEVDDSAVCPDGEVCLEGQCSGCATDQHCGPDCLACTGTTPSCIEGRCQCTSTSCGASYWCTDSGTCLPCDEPEHCGVDCVSCPASTPECQAGVCECKPGTCPAGQYCHAGVCSPCACPKLFPTYVDLGGTCACQCSDTSCGSTGTCESSSNTCVFADDFEGTSSMLTPCANSINSSWALGTPTIGECFGGSRCWVTNLWGYYNDCELSCLESPSFDLSGVTGSVDITLWAWYRLEYEYDGVTVLFWNGSYWQIVDPVGGWDVDPVILRWDCSWAHVDWPAFGQYNTGDAIGWINIHFALDSADTPELFHEAFRWRVYLETDGGITNIGWYMDDIEVRVRDSR